MSWRGVLHVCLEKNVPFFSYRLPASDLFVVGVQRSQKVEVVSGFDALDFSRKGFLVAPFLFGQGRPAYFLEADFSFEAGQDVAALCGFLEKRGVADSPASPSFPPMEKTDYEWRVNRLIAAIRAGEADKVVFSRRVAAPLPGGFDWVEAYRLMQLECPQAFVYCFHIPGEGLWMGATPELLLRKAGRHVETVALAGTMPCLSDSWSEKNREEHSIVVRYVERALLSHGVENLKKEAPVTVSAGSVCHLKTVFSADLRSGEDALPLLEDLHPTPAVCGYPKEAALKLIAAEETAERAFYAGFLGPIGEGGFSFFVNLRCMELHPSVASLFVGGGIMQDSDAGEEWNETCLKSMTMGRFVGLKQDGTR